MDGVESLLRDAQQEITKLRAELYTTRKELREAQQTAQQATAQRDSLSGELQGLQRELRGTEEQARRAANLERTLHEVEADKHAADAEILRMQGALAAASQAAKEEQLKASQAQDAKEKADADRLRLQRARDELARNLLGLERRAQEAEEELLRVEQESQAEIRSLQSRLNDESPASNMRTEGQQESAVELDRASLLKELEMEHQRASVLVAALNSAKKERDAARRDAEEAARQLHQAQQAAVKAPRAYDGSRGSALGLPPAAPRTSLSRASSTDVPALEVGVPPTTDAYEAARRQVGRLKASRDKLLAQLDSQAAEAERLITENTALTQALLDARKLCGAWEEQTNDSLAQIERLKDLLEESALWQSPAKPPRPAQVKSTEDDGHGRPGENGNLLSPSLEAGASSSTENGPADRSGAAAALKDLAAQVVEERARAAQLDLHLRALSAELLRTSEVTGDLERASLPALTAIEGRLSQMLQPASA